MSHVEILIPFSLPPAELASDLLQQLQAPALATLLGRSRIDSRAGETHLRALPHERWVAERCGLIQEEDDSPSVAPLLLDIFGQTSESGRWFVLQPVHIHIARDHLVLTDPRHLNLDEADSRTLHGVAAPLFAEAGLTLAWGDAQTWLLRADDWEGLRTATPDAAAGHNIDIWMPKGPHERAWRKIQNEVQMHWFGHPLNDAREARGLRPVNSLWLWGGGMKSDRPRAPIFSHASNLDGWYAGLRACVAQSGRARSAGELEPGANTSLVVLDDLSQAWLSSDWGSWLEGMQTLEAQWFAPLLEGVKSGHHDALSVVLSDDTRLLQLTATRGSLRKFWRKPRLAPLLPQVP